MARILSDVERIRVQDLLVQRATEGLDDAELAELARLDPDAVDDDSYDLAAAALATAQLPPAELPRGLAEQIYAAAARGAAASTAPAVPAVAAMLPEPVRAPTAAAPRPRTARRLRWQVPVAAAASLALAAGGGAWLGRRTARDPGPAAASAARREIPRDASALALPWTATADGTTGEVVWSRTAQRGVARFIGLPRNEPAHAQYQLWIFDAGRDPRYPVDGGVFDSPGTGELIVPIDARLPIRDPLQFMVTREPPGGSVVSERADIVVTTHPRTP